MRLYFKFEVNWRNGFKYIAFKRGVYSIHFKKFDGGHLDLSRLHRINSVHPLGGVTS